jgi:hypothetical protein
MKIRISNGKTLTVNHPKLPAPIPTPPLPQPKLILEKKKK